MLNWPSWAAALQSSYGAALAAGAAPRAAAAIAAAMTKVRIMIHPGCDVSHLVPDQQNITTSLDRNQIRRSEGFLALFLRVDTFKIANSGRFATVPSYRSAQQIRRGRYRPGDAYEAASDLPRASVESLHVVTGQHAMPFPCQMLSELLRRSVFSSSTSCPTNLDV